MAHEAMSPFGLSWAYLTLLLLPLLLAAVVTLLVIRRRSVTPALLLLVLVAVAAGAWALFTIGAPVTVPNPQDPDGSHCVMDPFGHNPGAQVRWKSDCGQALVRHLVVSAGPSLVMLGATATVAVRSGRGRRGQGRRTAASAQ